MKTMLRQGLAGSLLATLVTVTCSISGIGASPAQAMFMGSRDGVATAYFDYADVQDIRRDPGQATYYCARIATDAPSYDTDIQADLCANFLRDCAARVPDLSLRIEFHWYEYKCVSPAL